MKTTARTAHNKGRTAWTVLATVLLLTGFLCFFVAKWYRDTYGDLGFDSVLYTVFSDLGGVQSGLILSLALKAFLPGAVCTVLAVGLLFRAPRKGGGLPVWAAGSISVALTLALAVGGAVFSGMHLYIYDMFHESAIFEEEYVDPDSVDIQFPEEKRNLIYIFLESMETTYFDDSLGDDGETGLIPELYELAEENVNFSEDGDVGGFLPVSGTTWTIGAMVGQTAGVPLKTPDDVEDWQNGYGQEGEFLPGITNLGDILEENGYYQSLMVGSVCSFGGRKVYYETHGTDAIYELRTARADGIVPSDYFVWWGIEDKYLFEYAKQELTEIAAMEEPFAFTMLTVDTHHVGGYVCEYCGSEHEEQYENVISCSSKQVEEFVDWIQDQPFYEDTTIVIVGDHPSMDNGYFDRNVDEDTERRMYNCIINPAEEVDEDVTKNREFCTLDLFPTTLAALGCEIEGERLGLGTNLFSGVETLIEEMGYERFNDQLSQRSDYYAEEFRNETVPEEETEAPR